MELAGTTLEDQHWADGRLVVGLDEVGRGAWAGPVSVGAVALDPARVPDGLADSKLLRPATRERLAAAVRTVALGHAVGHATNDEIDRDGLAAALRLATRRALELLAATLPHPIDVVLVDGPVDLVRADRPSGVAAPLVVPVVGGDRVSVSIAAASIVAKVTRDAMLVAADADHAGYALASNKGYPSPAHRRALAELGPCALHRRSWRPIAALRGAALPTGDAAQSTAES
jgi:ribonuclease HII